MSSEKGAPVQLDDLVADGETGLFEHRVGTEPDDARGPTPLRRGDRRTEIRAPAQCILRSAGERRESKAATMQCQTKHATLLER